MYDLWRWKFYVQSAAIGLKRHPVPTSVLNRYYNREHTRIIYESESCYYWVKSRPTSLDHSFGGCKCELYHYENECLAEVAWMKEYIVNDTMSLHDVVFVKDTSYADDPNVVKAMELIDEQICPIYYHYVLDKFYADQMIHARKKQAAEVLAVYIKTSRALRKAELPDLPIELRMRIISQMNFREMNLFIHAGTLLKSQFVKVKVNYNWDQPFFCLMNDLIR